MLAGFFLSDQVRRSLDPNVVRKNRPPKAKIWKALGGYLEQMKFANSRINQGYLRHWD